MSPVPDRERKVSPSDSQSSAGGAIGAAAGGAARNALRGMGYGEAALTLSPTGMLGRAAIKLGTAIGRGIARTLQGAGDGAYIEAPEPLDLTIYQWLIDICVASGAMSAGEVGIWLHAADRSTLLTAITHQPGGATGVDTVFAPDEATTEDGDTIPSGVHLGTHRSSRAYMIDAGADQERTTLEPEAVEGLDGDSSIADYFEAHQERLIGDEFGAGATLTNVQRALHVARTLGNAELAEAIRRKLFRANQYAVIETLNSPDSDRYERTPNSTYCNIYAADFAVMMGAYVPRVWWNNSAIRRLEGGATAVTSAQYNTMVAAQEDVSNVIRPLYPSPGNAGTIREMNADSLAAWFEAYGAGFGWNSVEDMHAAQESANAGQLVIAVAANTAGSGHISVIPSESEEHVARYNDDSEMTSPLQSQAGGTNYKFTDTRTSDYNWWEGRTYHTDGFYVHSGSVSSSVATPEELGR